MVNAQSGCIFHICTNIVCVYVNCMCCINLIQLIFLVHIKNTFVLLTPIFYNFQFVKVGYAGSNFPTHIFPSLVGRPIIRSSVKVGGIEVKVNKIKPANLLTFSQQYLMYYVCMLRIWWLEMRLASCVQCWR